MDTVLRGLPRVFAYIDDILVFSASEKEHQEDLRAVFERLRQHGLTIRPEKCRLGQAQVDFLGFSISKDGLRPLPDKIRDLLDFPPPQSAPECRRFIGMVNYYHRFLPNVASVLRPLHSLADQPKRHFSWTAEHDAAFREVKQLLAKAATLAFPRPSAPTQGSRWVPIAFHSKKLSAAQLKWSTTDKELFALFSAIRHIAGSENPVSDCLSRPPQTVFSTGCEVGATEFAQMADEQRLCPQVAELALNLSLRIESRPVHGTATPLLVDTSTGSTTYITRASEPPSA
uniref:RNA-directed DNA polymerase n=1 Tax=Trichuris muris TaxID=70415 RepID=A0A5S6QM48_TRIMR